MDPLLERLRRGEPDAFGETIARYGPSLETALRRILPSEADDLVQETFARLFLNIQKVKDLRAWLFTVAMNLARSAKRRAGVPERPIAPVEDPELRESLDAAISALPERARAAFVLREVAGLSTAEVAKVEGCSEEAIRQRMVEARRKLRKLLGPLLERNTV